MRKLLFTLFSFALALIAYSQTEKTDVVEDCETVSVKYAQLLTKYSFDQRQSVLKVLDLWEESCGKNEPAQRVRILLDISNGSFVDSAYSEYFEDYIFDFFDRIDAAYKDDYKEIFDNNKAYFNYVPLRSPFDDWTWNISQRLREQQKSGTSAYLMTVLFSEEIKTFDDELKNEAYKDSYVKRTLDEVVYSSTKDDVSLVVNAGAWMPIGDLRWRFSLSPVIGVGANININEKYSIELGAQFTFWVNNKEIDVTIEDSLQTIKSKYGGTYGVWLHRAYSFDKEHFIDLVGGLAYTNMGTGIEKATTDEEESTTYYHIGTFDLSLGFNIRKRLFMRHDAGLNFAYHFRPYNLDKRLETKLGNHSYSVSLFYRF